MNKMLPFDNKWQGLVQVGTLIESVNLTLSRFGNSKLTNLGKS